MEIRVLFVNTTCSGISFWRMQNFWTAADRTGAMTVRMPLWNKDNPESAAWEVDVQRETDEQQANKVIPILRPMYTGKIIADMRQSDVVVMQMCHFPHSLNLFLALRDAYEVTNCPVVAEIDDNYLDTPAYNPAFSAYIPGSTYREIATKQFKMADAMIVSTPGLKKLYSAFNENIYIVENSIDFELWGKAKPRNKKGIRIGWIGGANHEDDLRLLVPVIDKIQEKHKDVKFVFVHGIPQFLKDKPGVECVYKFARIDKYPQHLADQDFDIGLFPLVANDFNSCKSNIRWLEYSSLGIPTVAYVKTENPGFTHVEQTMNHGLDGFISHNVDECVKYVELLIQDRKLRNLVGTAAKNRVYRDFNVDKTVFKYADILKEISDRGQTLKDEKEILQSPQITRSDTSKWEVGPLEILHD